MVILAEALKVGVETILPVEESTLSQARYTQIEALARIEWHPCFVSPSVVVPKSVGQFFRVFRDGKGSADDNLSFPVAMPD